MHAASGLFARSMELLAFASRVLAPKMVDLSVRFIRILFYCAFWAKRLVSRAMNLLCRGTGAGASS